MLSCTLYQEWQESLLYLTISYFKYIFLLYVRLVTQSYPTLYGPWSIARQDPPSVYGDSPGKNTKVGGSALSHGIFPTQRSNPGLPHCRCILYHLSYQRPFLPLKQ